MLVEPCGILVPIKLRELLYKALVLLVGIILRLRQEAALDDTSIYQSGDDAVGECYNDSDFTESTGISGGTTVGLNSLKLSVASGERHDGTQGTGARVLGAYTQGIAAINGNFSSTLEWLDLDGNGQNVSNLATWSSLTIPVINNLLVHDVSGDGGNYNGILSNGIRDALIQNCIVYNNTRNGSASTRLIYMDGERSGAGLYNNTCYNAINSGPGEGVGIYVLTDSSNCTVKNNLCVGDSDFSGFVLVELIRLVIITYLRMIVLMMLGK